MTKFTRLLRMLFVLLLLWGALSMSVYLYFLQPPSAVLSLRMIVLAGGVGLVGAVGAAAAFLLPDIRARLTKTLLRTALMRGMVISLVLWLVVPIPENYLLAPTVQLQARIQTEPGAPPPTIIWLHSGLGDIPYGALTLAPDSAVVVTGEGFTGLRLTPNSTGIIDFTWEGRAWREVKIVLQSDTAALVRVTAGTQSHDYQLNPTTNRELHITLPLGTGWYEALLAFLTMVAGLVSVVTLLAAAVVLSDLFSLSDKLQHLENTLPFAPPLVWVERTIVLVFALLAARTVWIGFNNRMYADDFTYAAAFRDFGFTGAIEHFLQQQNGRFMSHIFDLGILFLGPVHIHLGPLVVLIGLSAGLSFAFYHLLSGSDRWTRLKTALSFALILIITFVLLQPHLYEAVYWTLHALIVTGGLAITTVVIGILLWKSQYWFEGAQRGGVLRASGPSNLLHKMLWYIVLFVLSVAAAGFNESVSLVALAMACTALLVVLLRWYFYHPPAKRQFSALITPLVPLGVITLGLVLGLGLVVFAPGNVHRTSEIGMDLSPTRVIPIFLAVVHRNYILIFFSHGMLRLLLFGGMYLLGFFYGWTHPRALRFQTLRVSALERFMLAMAPFLFSLSAFLPAGGVHGYFPERTVFIPLYFLTVFSFVGAIYSGSAAARNYMDRRGLTAETPYSGGPSRLFSWVVLLAVLLIGLGGIIYLNAFGRQMSLFAAEWDAREAQIQQALAAGQSQVVVRPYQHTFGTDLTRDYNKWLYDGMREYYGIEFRLSDAEE